MDEALSESTGAESSDDPLDRVFPGGEDEDQPVVSGVDERRQRLLEPLGDPDREPW